MMVYIVANATRTKVFHIEMGDVLLCGRIAVGGYHVATDQELEERRLCGLCAVVKIKWVSFDLEEVENA